MTLTTTDLHETLEDERHGGWGYSCCTELPRSTREPLDRAIVAVANELGLDRERLFHWSNSKYGRWLYDAVAGNGKPPTRATVRELLNPEAMILATEGVYDPTDSPEFREALAKADLRTSSQRERDERDGL